MEAIYSREGWFVSHLFLKVDQLLWNNHPADEKERLKENFVNLFREYSEIKDVQIRAYTVWGLKADFAVMIIDPDLNRLNRFELDLAGILGPGVCQPDYSFVSMSEISEYVSQENDYDRTLREKNGLSPESAEYQEKMNQFRERIRGYIEERLYPKLPDHKVMCFYPMNKKRDHPDNWYLLDFEERKRFMASHAITGRKFQGNVKQLVTGSAGLDDWEWGVTLFANDPFYLKKIVYEMRYDEASARYGEFGPFLIGLRCEPDDLLLRLKM